MICSKIVRLHCVTDQVGDPGGDGLALHATVALVHARLRQEDARISRIDRNRGWDGEGPQRWQRGFTIVTAKNRKIIFRLIIST